MTKIFRMHANHRPACAVAELYVFDPTSADPGDEARAAPAAALPMDDLVLRLSAKPAGNAYEVVLSAVDAKGGELLAETAQRVAADALIGNLALVCDASGQGGGQAVRGNVRFWFRHWRVDGSKVEVHPERAFGPILWAQHTLSRGVLKLTAQMPPVGPRDTQTVRLEIQRTKDGPWATIGEAPIDPLARTATFRNEPWDASRDTPYRVAYALRDVDGKTRDHYWPGTIRHDPVEKETVVVAAFTGNADYGFPNNDVVAHVLAHDPDLLFFSGDNIYENVGGYGCQRSPLDAAVLDYLRKWYFYGWAFRDLMRDRPCVSIPDDHDVYQGNLWGAGGRETDRDNKGGYVMPAEWVRMVERTQTSHLPDPYDPAPIAQAIGVYYTGLWYGRISFAILEDRKFKSGPAGLVPATTSGRPDHVANGIFDPKTADVPGAEMLGPRQLKFLRHWAADWQDADMKCVLSQTVFAGAATHHGGGLARLVADYDSNGWPQTGRNMALRELRRGFAFHIAGDQHLATIIHHGTDDWGDAVWSMAVPSVANFYLRAWRPVEPGKNRQGGMPTYTGDFLDPFGNRITVWAATNPGDSMGVEPKAIHDKKPGYGIVRFDKTRQTITMECWPRFSDPKDPKAVQYAGWPKTIHMRENYGRKPAAWLPTVKVAGIENPVVQVKEEPSGQLVYALRVRGTEFRPWVFAPGTYTVVVGEPGVTKMQTVTVESLPKDGAKTVELTF